MAGNSRIFYGLQQVKVGSTVLNGVQSVGASSTTNVENFSRFGSIGATTILQDLDLEITIENALGSGWANVLTAAGISGVSTSIDTPVAVEIQYLTATGHTKVVTLSAILSSYSIQMGVDGPATESVTFQNAGTAVFTDGTDDTALGTPAGNICAVITRPNFSGFSTSYSDDACDPAPTWAAANNYSNVLSVSASMDIGTEKVNVLGQSLSFGKYVTFPIETSMEVELHLDPAAGTYADDADDTMGGFLSGSFTNPGDTSLIDRTYHTLIKLPSNYYYMTGARLTGVSRSGGDVGGGQVSITESFSSVNDLGYQTTDPSANIALDSFPAGA